VENFKRNWDNLPVLIAALEKQQLTWHGTVHVRHVSQAATNQKMAPLLV
jgi:hypothetical protein